MILWKKVSKMVFVIMVIVILLAFLKIVFFSVDGANIHIETREQIQTIVNPE